MTLLKILVRTAAVMGFYALAATLFPNNFLAGFITGCAASLALVYVEFDKDERP